MAYNAQLLVQRVYEEGEESLEDDKEESDLEDDEDEKTFLIDEALHIAYSTNSEDQIVIIWRDLSGEPGDHFEFICDASIKSALFDKFDLVARKCQYERKTQKDASNATEAELEAFAFDVDPEEQVPVQTSTVNEEQDFESASEGEEEDEQPIAKASEPAAPVEESAPKHVSVAEPEELSEVQGALIFESVISLHLFDATSGSFVEQLEKADVSIYDQGKFDFWLEVDSSSKRFIGMPIASDMNPVFNYEHLSFIFNFFTETSAFSWLLKFDTFEGLEKFQEAFMQALWETTNQQKWTKINDDARDYLAESFRDFNVDDADLEDIPEDDEEEYEEAAEHSTGLQQSSAGGQDYDEGYDEVQKMEGQGKNSQLAVGAKNDRTFVVRENRLGVFKQTADNELEFQTTIDNISNTNGKSFIPQKLMLHTQDRSMIMQDPENLNSLYRMDLEYGKVVEEWEVSDNHKVKAFAPSQKFAQTTDEQTIIGASDNGVFRIDPRLQGAKLVDSQLKSYATKVNFSSLATTDKGFIAVASAKGEIRMYDRLGINAKTQLPAMGDAIIGMDVSSDGKWILATCKTYLLLIDATIKEGKNAGQLGFLKSFGKDSKPLPKRLQISPEHLAHMQVETGQPLKFTMAHFNTGIDSREQTIVTSSGPFVITWSLKKLLRGDASPYLIKRYGANVAADNFKFGTDKNVIIALEDDVGMVDRRTFRAPTRESLATPARRIQPMSRNSIVKSAF